MLKRILKLGRLKPWSYQREILRREHHLNYLFWECTLNCNFNCMHCGSRASRKLVHKNELSTEEIKSVFKSIAARLNPKDIMIAVTGGEPLLRPDLFDVMSYAHNLGFNWGVVTNGFLVNENIIKKMKDSGMTTIVVSIDGLENIHDEFRQTPGSFKKAINAVKMLSKANFIKDLQITTTIHQNNFSDLEKMYQYFTKLNINSLRFMNIDPIGRAADNQHLLLSDNQLKTLMDFIKTKRKSAKINFCYDCAGFLGTDYEGEVRDWLFNCPTGINVASILHNGDIFVCPNVPRLKHLIQGNVRKDDFVNTWNHKFQFFRDPNRTACADCQACEWWQECQGNSMHLWDFENKKPKLCHLNALK